MVNTKKIFCVCLLIILVLVYGCASPTPKTPVELARSILGVSKNDTSSSFTEGSYNGETKTLTVNYDFFPVGVGDLTEETSDKMSSFFKSFYSQNTEVQNVIVIVALPYNDNFGNTNWYNKMSFGLTRETYNKINWDGFNTFDLWKISNFKKL